MEYTEPSDDDLIEFLLHYGTGLRRGGRSSNHRVLATYWTRTGEKPFAFCRGGILLRPEAAARYIPFDEIEDPGYHNHEMIERAKTARIEGMSAPLSIRLRSGEIVDLPMDVKENGMPDLLTIARLIEQRGWSYFRR